MKIKNIIKYKNKLLKLKLIKTKIYKKKDQLTNTRIEDIEYRLKALHVIYKYHTNNKGYFSAYQYTDKETKNLINSTNILSSQVCMGEWYYN
jgi:hypothetical protein